MSIKLWETHHDTIMLKHSKSSQRIATQDNSKTRPFRAVSSIPSNSSVANKALSQVTCSTFHKHNSELLLALLMSHVPIPCLYTPAIRAADNQGWLYCLSQGRTVGSIPRTLGSAGVLKRLRWLCNLMSY